GGTLKINAAPQPIASYVFTGGDVSNHGSGGSAMDGAIAGSGIDFSQPGHTGSGNSATFTGDGSAININSGITDLGGASRWTVAYWVKADSSGSGSAIFSKNTGGAWGAAGNSVFYLTDTAATGGTGGSVPGAARYVNGATNGWL